MVEDFDDDFDDEINDEVFSEIEIKKFTIEESEIIFLFLLKFFGSRLSAYFLF